MKYLFCYDISDSKTLAKISKILDQKGFRVQNSFFCCDLSKEEAHSLFSKIEKSIDNKTDRLALFSICEKCFSNVMHFGKEELITFKEFYIL